jgi:uncharacterized membrane protein
MRKMNDATEQRRERTARWHLHTISNAGARWRRTEKYIKSKQLWSRFYRTSSYLKSSLWTIPLFAIVFVLAIAPAMRALDAWVDFEVYGLRMAGAQALYQTVITLTLSFIVFTFGSLLVAIQVAGGQLTPRIIATTLLRDNVVRYSVGVFVFTLVFAVMALNRLEEKVHEIIAFITAGLGIACMASFLFLIDYAARLLRPISVLARVGNDGLRVIESVYPQLAGEETDESTESVAKVRPPHRIVRHSGKSEILLAVDLETLVAQGRNCNGVIELIPQVGDFVAFEEPLFALHGGAAAVDERRLRAAVAFGLERTLEQDPIFAFRILVDIGIKALSAAINDPTTGVLAIDQVQRLLRAVGKRQLRGELVFDDEGACRLIYRTPNWEDFVHVACTEIRKYGADNVQVARRLRAMFDNLIASLPAYRHPALSEERDRLDLLLPKLYELPGDLALARVADSQGLGGSSGEVRTSEQV